MFSQKPVLRIQKEPRILSQGSTKVKYRMRYLMPGWRIFAVNRKPAWLTEE
ncbi:hypothetical protein [Nitrosomonas oligotropha]|uniref:hypothetical protein n=1 Tax=Nitrosomonas oligotropha TaxID=42354 RepID=UPI0015A0B7E8|nr:hypothetical protein [Nitrosomonas oligotropha]